jgi:hypothetical protein
MLQRKYFVFFLNRRIKQMRKKDIKASNEEQAPFSNIKAYSIDEILTAGGTTAFAEKLGKNWRNLEKRLAELPKDAFLTDEEVSKALKILRESK